MKKRTFFVNILNDKLETYSRSCFPKMGAIISKEAKEEGCGIKILNLNSIFLSCRCRAKKKKTKVLNVFSGSF